MRATTQTVPVTVLGFAYLHVPINECYIKHLVIIHCTDQEDCTGHMTSTVTMSNGSCIEHHPRASLKDLNLGKCLLSTTKQWLQVSLYRAKFLVNLHVIILLQIYNVLKLVQLEIPTGPPSSHK